MVVLNQKTSSLPPPSPPPSKRKRRFSPVNNNSTDKQTSSNLLRESSNQSTSNLTTNHNNTIRSKQISEYLSPEEEQINDTLMEDLSGSSSASYANTWVSWFLASKGNEYFCEVDDEYIVDRFNLTGLNAEVQGYSGALELITDTAVDEALNDEQRDQLETSARHLYGLIHARFIITSRGLAKMIEKYKKSDFGRCPRVLCYSQPLLPLGLSDISYQKPVKLYCPRCEDLYSPKSSRHGGIDGAYFGSTFCHMLFMVYPNMIVSKSVPGVGAGGGGQGGSQGGLASGAAAKVERIRPRIFGFMVHEAARLQRWQEGVRDKQILRLESHERNGALD